MRTGYRIRPFTNALTRSRTAPRRFVSVQSPKHGAWLNLIEGAFSKMARTFGRHIRGASLDELTSRTLQGIDGMNATPVTDNCNAIMTSSLPETAMIVGPPFTLVRRDSPDLSRHHVLVPRSSCKACPCILNRLLFISFAT